LKVIGKKNKLTLHTLIYKNYLISSLIPIFTIEIILLGLYFGVNYYLSSSYREELLQSAKDQMIEITNRESDKINNQLVDISRSNSMLQTEHQLFFQNQNAFGLPYGTPEFEIASNGVYYKTSKKGSSLYYSAKTKISKKEKSKAVKTEFMDVSFQNLVDNNTNIIAVYFNSYDNMNRLYPFIDNVANQYGEHISMEEFNFYYLADLKHNPNKTTVWTGVYLDPAGNGWMSSCIVPIYNNNFLEGVTGIDVTVERFVSNVLSIELPWESSAFLVDKNGMILAMPQSIEDLFGLKELKNHIYQNKITTTIHKPEEFNILNIKNEELKKQLENFFYSDNKVFEISIKDKKYLIFQSTIKETGWKLLSISDETILFQRIKELDSTTSLVGLIVVLLMILFYFIFFQYLSYKSKNISEIVSKPIKKLILFTQKLSEDKNEISFPESNIVELDFIAQFSKELQQTNNSLKEAKLSLEESHNLITVQNEKLELLLLESETSKKQAEIDKSIAQLAQIEAEEEREKSENLLLNILPKEIAQELKINKLSEPKQYEMVTVLFTDFKGFTKITENTNPKELIGQLDNYFSYFDTLTDRYNLEKLKTIGDSYMCAAGIPIPNYTNPVDTVLAALEIQNFMLNITKFKDPKSYPHDWEVRIGIHTGNLLAGVIGRKKFSYDVWGETVNTASRMETSGTPGKVNISSATYQYVHPFFDCEYRGKIEAKNMGMIEMYYVNGIKKKLRNSKDPLKPSKAFYDLYDKLKLGNFTIQKNSISKKKIIKKYK
jgi:class 3 adenylate cyclase